MSKPIVKEHNLTTGEITEREMTDEEFQLYQDEMHKESQRVRASEEKVEKKTQLLDKLGITEEEAQLLLGGN